MKCMHYFILVASHASMPTSVHFQFLPVQIHAPKASCKADVSASRDSATTIKGTTIRIVGVETKVLDGRHVRRIQRWSSAVSLQDRRLFVHGGCGGPDHTRLDDMWEISLAVAENKLEVAPCSSISLAPTRQNHSMQSFDGDFQSATTHRSTSASLCSICVSCRVSRCLRRSRLSCAGIQRCLGL
jgi:hypothetical protein